MQTVTAESTPESLKESRHRRYIERVSREGNRYYTPRPQAAMTCAVCAKEFHGTRAGGRRDGIAYCSRPCAKVVDKAARHAKLKGATKIERVRPRVIYARDKFTCGICGKPIDMDTRAPHPLSPSLDHVVPLSAGGQHTSLNLRAAHFICNSRRGNRGPAQTRMI